MFKSVLLNLVVLASLAMGQFPGPGGHPWGPPLGLGSPSDHDSLHRKEPKPVPAGDPRPSDPPQADNYSGPKSASTVSALLNTFWAATARREKVSLLLDSNNKGKTTAVFKLGTTTFTVGQGECSSDADCPAKDPICSEYGYCQCATYVPGGPACWTTVVGAATTTSGSSATSVFSGDTTAGPEAPTVAKSTPIFRSTAGPEHNCAHDNEYIIKGNNIPGGKALQTEGATDCAQECTNHPECQAWTLKKDTNQCWLKKSNHGTATSGDWTWGPRCNRWSSIHPFVTPICDDCAQLV